MKSFAVTSSLLLAAAALLAFMPACSEHHERESRGWDDHREVHEESTYHTPVGDIHREHDEEIRR